VAAIAATAPGLQPWDHSSNLDSAARKPTSRSTVRWCAGMCGIHGCSSATRHGLIRCIHSYIMQTYNQLWTNQLARARAMTRCLVRTKADRQDACSDTSLNCVFVFGCQFSSSIAPARPRMGSSKDPGYCYMSTSRVRVHSAGAGLTLMGQLQSTWNFSGLAICVGQHLDSPASGKKQRGGEIWGGGGGGGHGMVC